MTDWKIKRGDTEFAAADDAMLRSWAQTGRIVGTDLVFHPLIARWMYANEVGELAGYLVQRPQVVVTRPETSTVTYGCMWLFIIVGVVFAAVLILPALFN